MRFHIETLVFVLSLTSMAHLAAVYIQFKVNRSHRGIGWWLIGYTAMALGYVSLSFTPHPALNALSVFGIPLLVLSRICLFLGVAGFFGKRVNLGVMLGCLVAVTAAYYYFLFWHLDLVARTVVTSLPIAAFSFLIAHRIFSERRTGIRLSSQFTAWVFLINGLHLVAVAVYTVLAPPVHSYLDYSLVQASIFMVPAITTTLWTFGLILMINQRLAFENALERKKLQEVFRARIQERRLAEEARVGLEARNRQLQKAESLGRMAGAIAHNFNNQLQAVMGCLELAGDEDPWLGKAKRATERAAGVSRMMLAYLGKTSGDQEPVWLSHLLHLGLPLAVGRLPPEVILALDCPSPGPVVLADATQVQEMLACLITNAKEALGEAPGRIRVALRLVAGEEIPSTHRFPLDWIPSDQDYACLEVADEGAGIPPEDLENVFDPFFSTKFTGRGLGLSVVLGRVQAHGGAVAVESEVGRGTTFRIYLPALGEGLPGEPAEASPARGPRRQGAILLVDDDEAVLLTTGILVEQLGYPLLTAGGGQEAVALFRQRREEICCVITDLAMPRMDGWETLAALRALDPNLPVILASGYDVGQAMEGEHPERPQGFLGKPFGLLQLRHALERVLG